MNNEEKILQMLGEIHGAIGEMQNDIRRINGSVTKLETLPKQINLIAEGHTGLSRQIDDMQQRMDRVEDKLDNAVIIKAVK